MDKRKPDDRNRQMRTAPRRDFMHQRVFRAGLEDEHVRHYRIQ
jgi:hypothetical protein